MSTLADIRIRTNLYLWLLTGRTHDFANAALNSAVRYSVKSTPSEVLYARSFLGLNDTQTDFNVLAMLAASKLSKALLRSMPEDNDSVFAPGLLGLPSAACSATLLGPTEQAWPAIDGSRAGADGFTSVVFRHAGGNSVRITTSAGRSELSDFVAIPEEGGTLRVKIPQAAAYGIRADFRVSAWVENSEISVTMAPTRFPFRALEQRLRRDRTMTRLMNAEGTLAAFESSAANPALQSGMAALAIIRRMIKWVNAEQSGFAVSTVPGEDPEEPLARRYLFDLVSVSGLNDPIVTNDQPAGFHV